MTRRPRPRTPASGTRGARAHHRVLVGFVAALALSLVIAAPALAAAGGGSGGFGGGGGGGRGAGLYILLQILIRLAVLGHGVGALVIIGLIVAYIVIARVGPGAQRARTAHERGGGAARRHVHRRATRVEVAATEAAEEDAAYAPDRVRHAAGELFAEVQGAWSAGDRARLGKLVNARLLGEWERRLDDLARRGWHNHVELLGTPSVQYVGLRHRGRPDDHVVVRIEATLRDYVEDSHGDHIKRAGRLSETVRVREFWTLGRTSEGWQLQSVQQGAEGSHALQGKIVATPWSDEQGLRDEALVEAAAAESVPAGTHLAELADLSFEGDARAAALDLSLADGRFAPDILEVCARRAVAGWADAIDGDEASLRALAAGEVVDALLHPHDPSRATRMVVRGPSVKHIRIADLQVDSTPPTVRVDVVISGRRYVEDRATTDVVAGNPARPSTFTERWTFALTGDEAQPWRIVAVDSATPAR